MRVEKEHARLVRLGQMTFWEVIGEMIVGILASAAQSLKDKPAEKKYSLPYNISGSPRGSSWFDESPEDGGSEPFRLSAQ
jgi:hypothetical protein